MPEDRTDANPDCCDGNDAKEEQEPCVPAPARRGGGAQAGPLNVPDQHVQRRYGEDATAQGEPQQTTGHPIRWRRSKAIPLMNTTHVLAERGSVVRRECAERAPFGQAGPRVSATSLFLPSTGQDPYEGEAVCSVGCAGFEPATSAM
jgi:hypothetical protein